MSGERGFWGSRISGFDGACFTRVARSFSDPFLSCDDAGEAKAHNRHNITVVPNAIACLCFLSQKVTVKAAKVNYLSNIGPCPVRGMVPIGVQANVTLTGVISCTSNRAQSPFHSQTM